MIYIPENVKLFSRLIRKEQNGARPESKKQKSSSSKAGGQVPIHLFFAKLNKKYTSNLEKEKEDKNLSS